MNVFDAIDNRVSTRVFEDKDIPLQTVRKILEYAYKIPSAGNLRPIELFYITYDKIETNVSSRTFILICADFDRTTVKYGKRGIRYVYMEAGHTAQNICLACEELGLGSCCIGAFDDEAVKRKYNLKFQPIYIVAIGYKK